MRCTCSHVFIVWMCPSQEFPPCPSTHRQLRCASAAHVSRRSAGLSKAFVSCLASTYVLYTGCNTEALSGGAQKSHQGPGAKFFKDRLTDDKHDITGRGEAQPRAPGRVRWLVYTLDGQEMVMSLLMSCPEDPPAFMLRCLAQCILMHFMHSSSLGVGKSTGTSFHL